MLRDGKYEAQEKDYEARWGEPRGWFIRAVFDSLAVSIGIWEERVHAQMI